MKKVYLKVYVNCNLGDDIFIYMITKRYQKIKFQLLTYKNYDVNYNGNLEVKRYNFIRKIANKLIILFSNGNNSLENWQMKKSRLTVLIGGSMFMENTSNSRKYFIGGGQPYYILGSNFGPYKTRKYFERFHNIFSNAKDVCFRDENSYNLFKDLSNVRKASDIIFGLDVNKYKNKTTNNVVISVVDCNLKVGQEYKNTYENKIIELINLFHSQNYSVTLMSFCKAEGDEDAIESIMNKLSKTNDVNTYFYEGNIDEALNIIGSCQIVVGTRFHANILGLIMNKTIIPIAYSDKTLNALKDINFNGRIFDIRDMDKFDVFSITKDDLDYKCDVSNQIVNSEKHFQELDEILGRD